MNYVGLIWTIWTIPNSPTELCNSPNGGNDLVIQNSPTKWNSPNGLLFLTVLDILEIVQPNFDSPINIIG